jgi:hypothetical protein
MSGFPGTRLVDGLNWSYCGGADGHVGTRKRKSGSGLPGGRRHGHSSQMWQFEKIYCRGKFVAVSGRKVAVKVPKMLKCGRRKLFLKISNKTDRNMTTSPKYVRFYKFFSHKVCRASLSRGVIA